VNTIDQIADLLTEDPDIFTNKVVLAVHPNHVIDAASAASSRWGPSPQIHGPYRLKILLNYIEKFKRFITQQRRAGSTIIVTFLDKQPATLEAWYDEGEHWQGKYPDKEPVADVVKLGMEQENVSQAHQDLMDFIHQHDDIHTVVEHDAGGACKDGRLQHILKGADEVVLIGGNLTGCLKNTLKALESQGLTVNVYEHLTFDDDPSFWERT
jgi:nicotinamidase-related amidase